jgi:hypothetical protein
MDLHAWITQQVDETERRARGCTAADWRHVGSGIIVDRDTDGWQHAPDEAVIVSVASERIYWNTSPPSAPDADHIINHSPESVLRRCEADRRILARHRLDPAAENTPRAAACDGCGVEWVQDYCDPIIDNLNDCPELLDLAHAHGITEQILASLDRPQPPEPKPRIHRSSGLLDARGAFAPPRTTADVPAALRGPNWQP